MNRSSGKPLIPCLFLAVSLLCCPVFAAGETPQGAKEPTTEERLEQAEQRIRELEKRLDQMESLAMAGGVTGAATAERVEPSRSPSEPSSVALVGDLKESHQALSGAELTSAEFPASWPMFGTDFRMKMGGYIKTDFVIDFDGTTDPSQFLMSTIPVQGTPEYGDDGYVSFFAKETRFNMDIRRIAPGATPLRGFLEGDFFTSNNQFRLRHAYMAVGDFLIGQTWTTLSFLESLPFLIDFAAGDALFGGRAAQVRYQHRFNDRWKMAVALEELSFLGIENPNGFPGSATRQLPLLALRADYNWGSGLLQMGTSVAQLHWDGGATGPSDSAVQYDFVVAGRQNLGSRAFATWNVSYGVGSGENIMAFEGSDANAVLDQNGDLDTIPAFAAVLGFGYNWDPRWSSNFSYAYGWLDTPPSRDPLALKRGGIGHVNLIWKPINQFSTGAEFMWGASRVVNGELGKAQRVQLMAKYAF